VNRLEGDGLDLLRIRTAAGMARIAAAVTTVSAATPQQSIPHLEPQGCGSTLIADDGHGAWRLLS
jgi:hypothetical protein